MAQAIFGAVNGSVGICISSISELKDMWTKEFIVDEIPWKVNVTKELYEENLYLGIFLHCVKQEKPLDWLQAAEFSIKLLTFNANVAAFDRHIQPYIYDHTAKGFGTPSFIKWDDLFDVSAGYVKNDTIKLEFQVKIANQHENTKSKLILNEIEKHQENCCWSKYRLTVTNIENLMAVRKSEIILKNISWILTVCKRRSGHLGVYLESHIPEHKATFKRTMSVKLLSSEGGSKSIEKIRNSDVGDKDALFVEKIILWSALLKPENEFVENGSIVMEVGIKLTQPTEPRPIEGSNDQAKRLKLECPICMDGFANKDLSSLPCGHMFCSPCINTAIRNTKRCPSCNKPATARNLRRCILPTSN